MLQYDCKHEGPWRAGMMRSNGCVTYSATRNVWPSMNKTHPRYPFLSNLKNNEDVAMKRQGKHKKKAYDMDRMLRKEIERKKSKVFRQQRHLSKKNMYYAKEYEENDDLDEGILEGSTAYRKSTIENKINNNKKVVMSPRTIDEADMTPGLQFVDAQKMKKRVPRLFLESLEIDGKVQSEMGENPKHTVLAKLMQSDFEEMEERRRFINLDRKKQDIERILEKMYKAMSGEGGEEEGGK